MTPAAAERAVRRDRALARRRWPADAGAAPRARSRQAGSAPRARRWSICWRSPACEAWRCVGPMIGRQHAYVLVDDWLGPAAPGRSRPRAGRARAAVPRRPWRRPTTRDLAKWAGLPLRDARAGTCSDRARAGAARGRARSSCTRRRARRRRRPPPRLLGAFEPVLLGWSSRAFARRPSGSRRSYPAACSGRSRWSAAAAVAAVAASATARCGSSRSPGCCHGAPRRRCDADGQRRARATSSS